MAFGILEYDDLQAIVTYFNQEQPKTPAAKRRKNDFASWYATLGWYDQNLPSDKILSHARNERDLYNRENSTSAEEAANVARVQKQGVSRETALNMPQKARTTEGLIAEAKEPLLSTPVKVGLAVGAGAVAVGVGLKKLHII